MALDPPVCPRCLSTDVSLEQRRCNACRIAYDKPEPFVLRTREHYEVKQRWVGWRERRPAREAKEALRVRKFIGLA